MQLQTMEPLLSYVVVKGGYHTCVDTSSVILTYNCTINRNNELQ